MKKRILIANPLWPSPSHTVRSANIVIYEMLCALSESGHEIGFLKCEYDESPGLSEQDQEGIRQLKAHGIDVLETLIFERTKEKRPPRFKLLSLSLDYFFPQRCFSKAAQARIMAWKPDVVIIPWSEWLTALLSDLPVKKFAYYGNPDHKVLKARARLIFRHGGSLFRYMLSKINVFLLKKAHLKIMHQYDLVGNVASNDADFYINAGHRDAFYIQNIWHDSHPSAWQDRWKKQATQPFKIIANVGKLSGTANSLGSEILAELVPKLKEVMTPYPFEIHMLGADELLPTIKKKLNDSSILFRGFVDDIDQLLIEYPVMLCLNNASSFKVNHTRYFHAWSLGSCVIAHADATLSVPEMVHNQNCLLGQSLNEIAQLIKLAARDPGLRERIGKAGYQTFKQYFTAEHVTNRILEKLGSQHQKEVTHE